MAKRRSYRRRAYPKVRRARSAGGSNKAIIDGLLAGAAASLIKRFVNFPFADDAALLGVGYFRNNNTLKTLGGVGLASDLIGNIGLGGTNGGGYI